MSVDASTPRVLRPEPLTADAFRLFGDVIEAGADAVSFTINGGSTTRFHDLANVDVGEDGGCAGISLFRATPLPPPIAITCMERHPLGSQAFVPLQQRPFLIAVAPAGDFDASAIRVFRAGPSQGVNYARGVWHHFLLALGDVSDFLVVDRIGPGDNIEEVVLAEGDRVIIEM